MGWCFRDPSLHDDIRRCAMSVGIRSRIARLAGLCGGSCAPNAMSHSVFPVQHHRHPSRSSAWFKAAQCAALELRDEEFASNFQSPFRCGALKVAFKQKLVPRVTYSSHTSHAAGQFKREALRKVHREGQRPRCPIRRTPLVIRKLF